MKSEVVLYNFKLGIPFAGQRVNGGSSFPSWVGIMKSSSGYAIYVFSVKSINRKDGLCGDLYVSNNEIVTIFYI